MADLLQRMKVLLDGIRADYINLLGVASGSYCDQQMRGKIRPNTTWAEHCIARAAEVEKLQSDFATPAGSASGDDGLGARIDRLIRLAQANEKIEALQAEVARLREGIVPHGDDMIVPVKLLDEINATGAAWKGRAEVAEAEVARLREDAERMAKWIVRHGPDFPGWCTKDHACAECVPGGELVKSGFRCATHTAAAIQGSANGQ